MYEIYVKNKNEKLWNLAIEVPNDWGGMPHLWSYLEKKYLPSYVPIKEDGTPMAFAIEKKEKGEYVSRMFTEGKKEILDLQHDPRLSYEEMMVFRSTLDFAMVIGEDIPDYLECLKVICEECGGIYPQQYQMLSDYIKEHSLENIEAIAFNQTSVNCASDFFGDMDAPISSFWDLMVEREGYNKWQKCKNI